jgi:hypothetical protein
MGSDELGPRQLAFGAELGETSLGIRHGSRDLRMCGLSAEPVDLCLPVGTGGGVDVTACFLESGLESAEIVDETDGGAVGLCGGALVGRPSECGGEYVVGAWNSAGAVVGIDGFADDEGAIGLPPSGHANVQVLSGGGIVHHEDGLVDGETLAFVDGDGVGEREVVGDVAGRSDDPASSVEGIEEH